jgi:exosome complex component RRP45
MMDQGWCPTVNEREFMELAFQSGLRVDGRGPFDFRDLKIALGRYLGSIPSEPFFPRARFVLLLP